ncbi:MAG TPA: hypothetical protein DC049_01120, partial [Spirochaetia bacterium]|nr:hypothetical protein [Spirochaetia bacterium]
MPDKNNIESIGALVLNMDSGEIPDIITEADIERFRQEMPSDLLEKKISLTGSTLQKKIETDTAIKEKPPVSETPVPAESMDFLDDIFKAADEKTEDKEPSEKSSDIDFSFLENEPLDAASSGGSVQPGEDYIPSEEPVLPETSAPEKTGEQALPADSLDGIDFPVLENEDLETADQDFPATAEEITGQELPVIPEESVPAGEEPESFVLDDLPVIDEEPESAEDVTVKPAAEIPAVEKKTSPVRQSEKPLIPEKSRQQPDVVSEIFSALKPKKAGFFDDLLSDIEDVSVNEPADSDNAQTLTGRGETADLASIDNAVSEQAVAEDEAALTPVEHAVPAETPAIVEAAHDLPDTIDFGESSAEEKTGQTELLETGAADALDIDIPDDLHEKEQIPSFPDESLPAENIPADAPIKEKSEIPAPDEEPVSIDDLGADASGETVVEVADSDMEEAETGEMETPDTVSEIKDSASLPAGKETSAEKPENLKETAQPGKSEYDPNARALSRLQSFSETSKVLIFRALTENRLAPRTEKIVFDLLLSEALEQKVVDAVKKDLLVKMTPAADRPVDDEKAGPGLNQIIALLKANLVPILRIIGIFTVVFIIVYFLGGITWKYIKAGMYFEEGYEDIKKTRYNEGIEKLEKGLAVLPNTAVCNKFAEEFMRQN